VFPTKNFGLFDFSYRRLAQMYDDDPVVMIDVMSSNVESFGYDEENMILYVRFLAKGNNPSSLYAYYDVGPDIYQAMFESPSKGQFVWQYLRDRYTYQRLS
jgi:hypothetical protein